MSKWVKLANGRTEGPPFSGLPHLDIGHSLLDMGCSHAVRCKQTRHALNNRCELRGRAAFTLIEVLLVLAILGVMVTVLLPQVMGSLREHQLRGATRAVISAGRHAMSLAVLSQRQMTVVYDLDATTMTIQAARVAGNSETHDASSEAEADAPLDAWEASWETDQATADVPEEDGGGYKGAMAIVDEEVVYEPDGITFSFIEIDGEGGYRAESGTHTIIYYTNGRCTPYTIGFTDEDDASAVVEVDALASARVVRE